MKTALYALRSALLYLCITIVSLIWLPLLFIALIVPLSYRLQLIGVWSRIVRYAARLTCGISYSIVGKEHLNAAKPGIIFCKHQSAWETLVLPSIIPMSSIICKKELLLIPVFGWGLWTIRPIAINRKQALKAFKQVAKQGKDRLDYGLSIVVFPEGTRVPIHTHPEFHKSGAALAKTTGYPVIPMAVNSGHVWPRKTFIKRPGHITIEFGPAIASHDKSIDEINELAYHWMKSTMQRLEKLE